MAAGDMSEGDWKLTAGYERVSNDWDGGTVEAMVGRGPVVVGMSMFKEKSLVSVGYMMSWRDAGISKFVGNSQRSSRETAELIEETVSLRWRETC